MSKSGDCPTSGVEFHRKMFFFSKTLSVRNSWRKSKQPQTLKLVMF